jgi:hypothetical protein
MPAITIRDSLNSLPILSLLNEKTEQSIKADQDSLIQACKDNDQKKVEEYFQKNKTKIDLYYRDALGKTVFHYASRNTVLLAFLRKTAYISNKSTQNFLKYLMAKIKITPYSKLLGVLWNIKSDLVLQGVHLPEKLLENPSQSNSASLPQVGRHTPDLKQPHSLMGKTPNPVSSAKETEHPRHNVADSIMKCNTHRNNRK